ncbi:uncharacterized protein L201_004682 [Kwoniella dendrophila CBS 6074]|uniref:Zn(2)-C6 fungal-type domain-containing protein n=1 Tax=Kwoniella dendrophila CBS 6074 TaxID=1295534 RepID=A0AAX4JWE2_9TREE
MAPSHPAPSVQPVLPGPSQRKQNLACDSCRKRKVRCLRTDKTQICQQCSTKGEECTNHYIDSLTQAKNNKRRKLPNNQVHDTIASKKKKRNPDDSIRSEILRDESQLHSNDQISDHTYIDPDRRRDSSHTILSTYDPGETSRQGSISMTRSGSFESPHHQTHSSSSLQIPNLGTIPVSASVDPSTISFHAGGIACSSTLTEEATQQNMLKYLCSPTIVVDLEYGYNDISSYTQCRNGKSDLWEEQDGQIWHEEPTESHKSLNEETMRDLIDDLLETFFSIVQTRYTTIDSTIFRERFSSPLTHTQGPISHALLAIILAWGARFSDHPMIEADKEECSYRDGEQLKGRQRSRFVSLMVIRAREIAEKTKIFRVPSMESAHSCLLLEHLLGHYQATYISAAVKHIISMGFNSSDEWTKIQDVQLRNEALNVLWLVRMSDVSRAALYRLRPSFSAEDFDVNPTQHAMLSEGAPMMVPLGGSEHNIVDRATWFKIYHTFCSICYTLAKSLWIPSVSSKGIPLGILREFIHSSSIWRDKYLSSVGIPTIWPNNWDFLQAISTCTVDCYYHNLWLIVHKAIQDFGIKEDINANGGGNKFEIDNMKRRIKEEAEHAALRIAALTGVLTENGYLKLDPLIINQPIQSAGLYLASLGRSEYLICVAGLRQYSTIFPCLWDQANQLDNIYRNVNETNILNGLIINNQQSNLQSILSDGMGLGMEIPPRLDLMGSFEDWTGSMAGSHSQFSNSSSTISPHDITITTTNNYSDQGKDSNNVTSQLEVDLGDLANNIHGHTPKDPVNVGHWLGW